ncbi:MAG: ATP-grasp domain-containing protein [candidate division WWE3 bacterium]|nr:ATP-grasp domain-containing protein [candidate division WWE3 bacterium]
MNIAFVYNVRHLKPALNDPKAQAEAEYDTPETIAWMKESLEKLGHTVHEVEATTATYEKLRALKKSYSDLLVFNYSEGIGGNDHEAQISAICEILDLTYTGSSVLTSAIILNKARTKEILKNYHIPTPEWIIINPISLITPIALSYPLIVKPNSEGSSKGIFNNNVVNNLEELTNVVTKIRDGLQGSVLLETYLPGREFTVAMLRDQDAWRVLPIIEVKFDELPDGMYPIDSYEVKWIYDSPENKIEPLECPAKIDDKLRQRIKDICIRTCEALEVRDYCRIDVRLDANDNPYVLEVNSPPGMAPNPAENSRFPYAARKAGMTYEELLDKIIQSALRRR